jgi:hypothetical protein
MEEVGKGRAGEESELARNLVVGVGVDRKVSVSDAT